MPSQKDQYQDYQFAPQWFFYKGEQINYSEIKNLTFLAVNTQHKINFADVGTTRSAVIFLTRDDDTEYRVAFNEDTKGWKDFFKDMGKDVDDLHLLYKHLSQTTFQNRINRYISQIEQNGFFEYENFRFYPKDRVEYKNKVFPLHDTNFTLKGKAVVVRKKDHRWWNTVIEELTNIPQFVILTDQDCIYPLLKEYMGITWKTK